MLIFRMVPCGAVRCGAVCPLFSLGFGGCVFFVRTLCCVAVAVSQATHVVSRCVLRRFVRAGSYQAGAFLLAAF